MNTEMIWLNLAEQIPYRFMDALSGEILTP